MTEQEKPNYEEGKIDPAYQMLKEVGMDIDEHLREGRLVTALLLADNLDNITNSYSYDPKLKVATEGIYACIAAALERRYEERSEDLTPSEKRILEYANSKAYKAE